MTSDQYREDIATLGLTQASAAEFLGVSLRTSSGYANGAPIPHAVELLLNVMIENRIKPEELNGRRHRPRR